MLFNTSVFFLLYFNPSLSFFHTLIIQPLILHDLRWMNSNVSLSHLNGFFLRLRIGKWGTRLGGTGYYVACITGT